MIKAADTLVIGKPAKSSQPYPTDKDESLVLLDCAGRISAETLAARISFPSIDVSLKDDYVVQLADVVKVCAQNPKAIKLAGPGRNVMPVGRSIEQPDGLFATGPSHAIKHEWSAYDGLIIMQT